MKKIGVVSYNIYCNFTNYGSALQSYALCKSIDKLGYKPYLINYRPECLNEANPLNPFKKLWDKKDTSLIRKAMPYIKRNYLKFCKFYKERFNLTTLFTKNNFNKTRKIVNSYVCGSDTIFCKQEFGFDNGYFANYRCMQNNSITYAASFGNSNIDKQDKNKIKNLLNNFKYISLREGNLINKLTKISNKKIYRVLDPTLLLSKSEYLNFEKKQKIQEDYLLLYLRRRDKSADILADKIAKQKQLKIVEISLDCDCVKRGRIYKYDAGVEEFIGLIHNSKYVITNSYHGMIFSIVFRKPFSIFYREGTKVKTFELLKLLKLTKLLKSRRYNKIKYNDVKKILNTHKQTSLKYLKKALDGTL